MIRAKKQKKQKKPEPTRMDVIKMTNYLHLAVIVRVLWTVYDWRGKRIGNFLIAYLSLFQEIVDKRSTVNQFIKDTKEMTGVDVVELLDEVTYGKTN